MHLPSAICWAAVRSVVEWSCSGRLHLLQCGRLLLPAAADAACSPDGANNADEFVDDGDGACADDDDAYETKFRSDFIEHDRWLRDGNDVVLGWRDGRIDNRHRNGDVRRDFITLAQRKHDHHH